MQIPATLAIGEFVANIHHVPLHLLLQGDACAGSFVC
jgi:hypothetical protein